MKEIRSQIDKTTSDYDREKLQERLAKLVGGVAVIKVGAATETEMKEKKARVEDAMHATRAAVEEGIVPGGGVALARCVAALDKLKLEGDEQIGVNIVKRALEEPLRQIVENAGEEGAVVVGKIHDSKDTNFGYNAQTGEYEDLVKAGVLDPTKVVRTALHNAGSIAALMLTTEALVAEIPEKKDAPMPVAVTAAAWTACTKKRHERNVLAARMRSTKSAAADIRRCCNAKQRKSPARKSGAFCLAEETQASDSPSSRCHPPKPPKVEAKPSSVKLIKSNREARAIKSSQRQSRQPRSGARSQPTAPSRGSISHHQHSSVGAKEPNPKYIAHRMRYCSSSKRLHTLLGTSASCDVPPAPLCIAQLPARYDSLTLNAP